MTAPERGLRWLGDPDACDPAEVGGKAAALSRLAAELPVPEGFCLVPDLAAADPRTLQRALRPAYRRLGACCGQRRPPVAVRSSAPAEDSAAASFAGAHETVLGVVGVRAIVRAVPRCCASATAGRAAAYREASGLAADATMAVLVQRLADADVAGVAFSANPVTGDGGEVVINASWGLGAAVVDGTVTPDTYVVAGDPPAVCTREVADKDVMVVRTRRGTRTVPVPRSRRRLPALSAEQCAAVARLAAALEERHGHPVDLEFAYEGDRLLLLQCRPITSLPTS